MKLKELREKKSLTLEELSEKAGVSSSIISSSEEGRVTPSEMTGTKLAKGLEVRPADIEEVVSSASQRL